MCHQLTRKLDTWLSALQVMDTTTTYKKKLMVLGFQWFPPFYHRQRTMVWALLVVVMVITLSVALALVEDDAACYRLGRAVKSTAFPFMLKRLPCSGLILTLSNERVLWKCYWHIYMYDTGILKIRLFMIFKLYYTSYLSYIIDMCSTYPFGSFDRSAVNL